MVNRDHGRAIYWLLLEFYIVLFFVRASAGLFISFVFFGNLMCLIYALDVVISEPT